MKSWSNVHWRHILSVTTYDGSRGIGKDLVEAYLLPLLKEKDLRMKYYHLSTPPLSPLGWLVPVTWIYHGGPIHWKKITRKISQVRRIEVMYIWMNRRNV